MTTSEMKAYEKNGGITFAYICVGVRATNKSFTLSTKILEYKSQSYISSRYGRSTV